jgi:hypothetical protein
MTVLPSCIELPVRLSDCRAVSPPGSICHREGGEVIEMALAYCRDAATFSQNCDPVNELAACWYALAWLDCGECLGIISTVPARREWPPGLPVIGPDAGEKLEEKAVRYQRLLTEACNGLERAGEGKTTPGDAADRILVVGKCFLAWGMGYLGEGRMNLALACFSYGHGWLDCGVRTGLFRITGARDLFAV